MPNNKPSPSLDSKPRPTSRIDGLAEGDPFKEVQSLLDSLPSAPYSPPHAQTQWRIPNYAFSSAPRTRVVPADPSISPLSPPRNNRPGPGTRLRSTSDPPRYTSFSSQNPLLVALPRAYLGGNVPASPGSRRRALSTTDSLQSSKTRFQRERVYGSADARTLVNSDNGDDKEELSAHGADDDDYDPVQEFEANLGQHRPRGFFTSLLELYRILAANGSVELIDPSPAGLRARGLSRPLTAIEPHPLNPSHALDLDPDDPLVTGRRVDNNLEPKLFVNYKNIPTHMAETRPDLFTLEQRLNFILKLARSLMKFSAPTRRIESQLASASRFFLLDADFVHIPGVTICAFTDMETQATYTQFISASDRLALSCLHEVHTIYRRVLHGELDPLSASRQLQTLLDAGPLYGPKTRVAISAAMSLLICPLAFGGSLLDMGVAGVGGALLMLAQIYMFKAKKLYSNVYEVFVAFTVSIVARSLSSIHGDLFCYSAISSAIIFSILPGFFILNGSLELTSKNMISGSAKLVHSMMYILFLAFALFVGSELYLILNHDARNSIADLITATTPNVTTVTTTFISDNGTFSGLQPENSNALTGTFTFTPDMPAASETIYQGCLRPPDAAWYLRPFPLWTQIMIVPVFSLLTSLSHEQRLWTLEMLVMVVISCLGYVVNKGVSCIVVGHSDIVSAVSTTVVGLLGHIYSRVYQGTAFTAIVPSVLFLLPMNFSHSGGLLKLAQGNGMQLGASMIGVSIGMTAGLFLSQTVVYMFGSRKRTDMFSF